MNKPVSVKNIVYKSVRDSVWDSVYWSIREDIRN